MKTPSKKDGKEASSPEKEVPVKVETSSRTPSKLRARVKAADQKNVEPVPKAAGRNKAKISSSGGKLVSAEKEAETKLPKTASGKPTKAVSAKNVAKVSAAKPVSPVKRKRQAKKADLVNAEAEPAKGIDNLSRVDKLLAQPDLPRLEHENRARLQMQTPTRLYFYWSVRQDPWRMLRKAFGDDTGGYTLVLKLVELRSGAEEIYNADGEGNWWFDVRPDGEYVAEIGFYAPNRPYFRIVYSNVVETPRKKPSPRRATDADWTVTADRFARVLDVAGFTQDAVEVAIAGDDLAAAGNATRSALRDLTGNGKLPSGLYDEDIRFAMTEMAGGQKLDNLRWKISAELFAYLQSNEENLGGDRAKAVLKEHFEIDDLFFDTEEFGPAVFGASLVNFPRTLRARRTPRSAGPGYSPESSHSYRGFRQA